MSRISRKGLISTVLIAAAVLGTSACNPILRTHGYVPTETDKPQQIMPGTDTKATVLARLGNPSTEGVFEKDVWYYMSSVQERLAYIRPQISDRNITAVVFDDDGSVQAVAEYKLENGNIVDFVGRETPTRGRQLSVLEQIFGTIGLPTDQLNRNQDVPGGGGGPGG